MRFLLDTNVVCEATSRQPSPQVLAWCAEHIADCALSAITLGEIWKGIHLLPAGKRRNSLATWASGIESDFPDRILPLDPAMMKEWGKLYAKHQAAGFNMTVLDSLIAATAVAHGLTVATRNTSDFPSDLRTINPWNG
ncbi:MAG: type II toxin-antitoxin system VapC family toxin [Akkermansiaceae bacterium]|nr:type II toxin-antitoxin system VapC family toxin [Akkermansiaceae bacterium]